ncbi:MAG: hypothetical protein A2Z14_01980 [Chloroflexi bacterium RBG_16_48_8]|nr:MAG: hypothetical protein A2Z14_01980 [Chloroflexi bacterium RBG_16_48_8]
MLGIVSTACNFPGVESTLETPLPSTGVVDESAIPYRPDQQIETPTTKPPDQTSPEDSQGKPFMTAKGSVDCLAAPLDGSETMTVFTGGDTATILGKTPNGKWFAVKEADKPQPCWVPAMAVELNVNPDVLEVISPPVASTPSLGSISGVLWHERCDFTGGQAGEPLVLGQGCVQWGAEVYEFGPNQIYDPFETGWSGVRLHLGMGPCPSTGLETTITDTDGEYVFLGLNSGTYCVSYSALTDGNDSILIPGGPTFPERGENGFYQTVTLGEGENATGVDFGYAWQFYD